MTETNPTISSFNKPPQTEQRKLQFENTISPFRTIQKNKNDDHQTNQMTTASHISNHSYLKKTFRNVTLKYLANKQIQIQQQLFNDNDPKNVIHDYTATAYKIITRIIDIENQVSRYAVNCSDTTLPDRFMKFYYLKHNSSQGLLNYFNISKIKNQGDLRDFPFEPTIQNGHPYIKMWIRFSIDKKNQENISRWLIDRVEQVQDYDQLTYHWSLAMFECFRFKE